MVKNWDTIQVRTQVKEQLTKIYNKDTKRPENQKFTGWLDNWLGKLADFCNSVSNYGYFLEYINADGKLINLYDHRIHESITVEIDQDHKELVCHKDNKSDCLHVGFSFAVPEVYKVLIDQGFKEPKS